MSGNATQRSSVECDFMEARLNEFGFAVPPEVSAQWDDDALRVIASAISNWEADALQTGLGIARADRDRTEIPPALSGYEVVDAVLACRARDSGRTAAGRGWLVECNPYPLDTALSKIWCEAFLRGDMGEH